MAKTKTFNGRIYRYWGNFRKKSDAKALAGRLRKGIHAGRKGKRYNVRIVPSSKYSMTSKWGYAVYFRRRY